VKTAYFDVGGKPRKPTLQEVLHDLLLLPADVVERCLGIGIDPYRLAAEIESVRNNLPGEDLQRARPLTHQVLLGSAPPKKIRRHIFWKLDAEGNPVPDFTDTPHLYQHAHLVEIPVPQDVQDCMSEFKDPPPCLIIEKSDLMAGDCPERKTP
jgi:hypothetical protein